jgi:hypothetical protein
MSGGHVNGFRLEAEMVAPAKRWLKAAGLLVRAEVPTPWGVCDLVGARLSKTRADLRLRLGQKSSIRSLARTDLLMRVPHAESNRSITVRRLQREFAWLLDRRGLARELDGLVRQGFLVRQGRTRVQRLNGWAPLHTRLVAVELKLDRVEEAFHQARTHLAFTATTYVGLPESSALRAVGGPWKHRFKSEGIGLLSVARGSCKVLVKPKPQSDHLDDTMAVYVAEKFWPMWLKDSSS